MLKATLRLEGTRRHGRPADPGAGPGHHRTRAILFAADGTALAEAGRPLQQHYPQDGWVEHDAEEIFAASAAVLREAVEKAGRRSPTWRRSA
jgi:glycerol kinase